MSTVKSKKLQVGTDASASNNFTIYQPSTPDGTLRIGVGNADNPTEIGRFTSAGYKPATAPLFFAYSQTIQNPSLSTPTKMLFDTELHDTNNNFASSRFTPTVAGYYYIIGKAKATTNSSVSNIYLYVNKNGSNYEMIARDQNTSLNQHVTTGSCIVYCNGTTDYIELYINILGSGTPYVYGNSGYDQFENSSFSGYLVQQA